MGAPKGYTGPPQIDHITEPPHNHPFTAEQVRAAHRTGQAKRERHAGVREQIVTEGPTGKEVVTYVDKVKPTPYAEIAQERRTEWREHTTNVMDEQSATALDTFRDAMRVKYGTNLVKMHLQVIGWKLAFMVQRYGEEVAHWPNLLTDADRKRMEQMRSGAPSELGGIQPLYFHDGVLQFPEGAEIYGLRDLQPGD